MHGTSRKTTRLYHGRSWNCEEGEELKRQKEYNR